MADELYSVGPSTSVLKRRHMASGFWAEEFAVFDEDQVLQTAATATGNGVAMDVSALAAVAVQVAGITTATITWEATIDGTTWVAVPFHNASTGLVATAATADGLYSRRVAGLKQIRARISAYTSGTITATGHGIAAGDAGQIPALLLAQLTNPGDTALRMLTPGDAVAALASLLGVGAIGYEYNGATYDRVWNNVEGQLLALGARTGNTDSADQINYNGHGVAIWLNVTVASGTGGLTVKLQGKDPVSAGYKTIAQATAAVIATGLQLYGFAPNIASFGTEAKNTAVPRTWRVEVGHGDGTSYTYSVGYALLS